MDRKRGKDRRRGTSEAGGGKPGKGIFPEIPHSENNIWGHVLFQREEEKGPSFSPTQKEGKGDKSQK